MEASELIELHDKAHRGLERKIGITMAIFAALLAAVTLMGHRLHTEEVVLQTRLADQWAYYQAKNTRSQMYATDARLAELQGAPGTAVAAEWVQKAADERKQADEIRRANEELDHETQGAARRATLFDGAEVVIEIAIVLCSIALLTGTSVFWRISFAGAAIGAVMAAFGFLR
jgi:uncharacterized protein DUF4337